jgi:hypothetical protein
MKTSAKQPYGNTRSFTVETVLRYVEPVQPETEFESNIFRACLIQRVPAFPAAATRAESISRCADSTVAQRLFAAGRLYLRRAGLESGIQHRRSVHPVADVAHERRYIPENSRTA